MSRVIKAKEAGAVSTAFRTAQAAEARRDLAPAVSPEWVAAQAQITRLSQELEAREEDIRRLREDVVRARREGEAAGREAGRSESDARRADYLRTLQSGVDAALSLFKDDLAALERLSVVLAEAGLSKILGPGASQADLLPAAIRWQLQALEAQSIVRVSVSRRDFADDDELAAFAVAIDRPGLKIEAVEALAQGECRIKLVLGELDVGIDRQWTRLAEALDQLAGAEAAS